MICPENCKCDSGCSVVRVEFIKGIQAGIGIKRSVAHARIILLSDGRKNTEIKFACVINSSNILVNQYSHTNAYRVTQVTLGMRASSESEGRRHIC